MAIKKRKVEHRADARRTNSEAVIEEVITIHEASVVHEVIIICKVIELLFVQQRESRTK